MRTITRYTHYNFIDKDPIFDRLKSIIDGHGLTLKDVADESGMSVGTLRRWFYGDSRNAYFSSIVRVVIALRRWDFKLIDGVTLIKEQKSAKVKLLPPRRKINENWEDTTNVQGDKMAVL